MLNQVTLIGNLGADPDCRQTAGGTLVVTLSVATSERRKQRDGTYADETEWHRVVVFGHAATFAQQYLAKGRKVAVVGRIKTRSWDDPQTGQKRFATEILADTLKGLDRADDGGQRQAPPPQSRRPPPAQQSLGDEGGQAAYFDDDVPF